MPGKLKLNLDQLEVDSFDTVTREKATRGTVHGEQCTCYTNCTCPGCPTCDGYATCGATCPNTCDDYSCAASCNGTCDYSCGGTCDYFCGGTANDATCRNIGTCSPWVSPCPDIP